MVKFSKDLEAQLIPEWKDAFVNYWQLKKHVKKIKLSRKSPKQTQDPNGDFGLSIFDPIHFVVNKISNCLRNTGDKPEIIQVKSKVTEREDDEEVGEVYETELSQLFSEEDEVKLFFERLDEELNKVNQFYKTKESEFLRKGEILNKKLQTLLEGKQILSDRCRKSLSPAGFFPPSYSSSARNSDYSENPTEYNESLKEPSQTDDATASPTKTKKENSKMGMRVDIPPTTPTWAISSVTSMLREDIVLKNPKKKGQGDLITRKKTQCDEKMIRGTFVELYKGLGLLKTYRLI